MIIRSKKKKGIVAFLCILIIISYASVIFLPHAHDCVGFDCTVCALIKTARRNTIVGLVLATTVYQSANIIFTISSSYKSMPLCNDGTPVALKVKLSD